MAARAVMLPRHIRFGAAAIVLAFVACLSDPVGPGILTIATEGAGVDTVWLGAPGEALPSQIRLRVTDDAGRPLSAAAVTWEAVGRNAQVLAPSAETNAAGLATAGWLLGTDAAEEQQLHVAVRTTRHESEVVIRARAVPRIVSQIRVLMDSAAVVRLGDTVPVAVNAVDPYGNVFPAPDVTLSVTDSAIGAVAGQAFIAGPKRGRTSLLVTSHGIAAPVAVRVTQYVASIVPLSDTLQFSALGAQRLVGYVVRDDRGRVVEDTAATISVVDSSVARLTGEYVRAVAPGFTTLRLVLAPAAASIPVGVRQRVGSLRLMRDTIRLDALRDTTTVNPIVQDSLGSPIPDPILEYEVHDANIAQFATTRTLQALSLGATTVTVRDPVTGISTSAPVVVRQVIAKINLTPPVIAFDALGDTLSVGAIGEDRLGSVVSGAALDFSVGDAQVATFESGSRLRSVSLGHTLVVVSDPETGIVATADVQVTQRVTTLNVTPDSLLFDALGDTLSVGFTAWDHRGAVATTATVAYTSSDPTVISVTADGLVRSRGNGMALVIAQSADGPSDTSHVFVHQIPDSIVATVPGNGGILSLLLDSQLPVSCAAYDGNGFPIAITLQVAPSQGGRWSGGNCADLRIRRSGFDTLHISAGTVQQSIPVILAVRPIVTPPLGDSLVVDSLPAGTAPWAPTIRQNSAGGLEVFFAAYKILPGGIQGSADLHRLISGDGVTFRYDGLVLEHDSVPCSLQGSGIENVDILPRSDGPGWRMYYAAGSFDCYGWQVFSAVSTDERTWVKEPGIRLSNGGSPPPAGPNTPPWPVGEGMVTEQLPSGDWRMLVSTYEHVVPVEDKFQITEWRSANQLDWTYAATVFSTRQLPPQGQRSVYSPTIRQFAPGLWRMIMTADDLNVPGGTSRLWSAISTDQNSWQLEGELLGDAGIKYFYATLASNVLVTIRGNDPTTRRLYIATVQMP